MEIGLIGLGKMGGNMARRWRRGDAAVVGWDRAPGLVSALADEIGLRAAATETELVGLLAAPRVVWLMLPAGAATESAIAALRPLLAAGDLVVDGANSHFRDSQRRAALLAEQGIGFIDVGVSGGVWGLREGYCLMAGGTDEAVARVEPWLRLLAPAPDRGWLHCGPVGSGHYAKMIHNGIEYGLMQAYAEGFALLRGRTELDFDLAALAECWRHGSVVRSWLLDLAAETLARDPDFNAAEPRVADSGEGRWAAWEAIEQGVPAPVMSSALMARFASQGGDDYSAKMLVMLRQAFGGHTEALRQHNTGNQTES